LPYICILDRHVSARAPTYDRDSVSTAIYPEVPFRRSENGHIDLSIAIVISRCRNVGWEAELIRRVSAARVDDKPDACLRAVNRDIGFSVSIVICRCELITRSAKLLGKETVTRAVYVPYARARPVDGHITLSVTIEIDRGPSLCRRRRWCRYGCRGHSGCWCW